MQINYGAIKLNRSIYAGQIGQKLILVISARAKQIFYLFANDLSGRNPPTSAILIDSVYSFNVKSR